MFILAEILYFESQTNRKLKNFPRIKIAFWRTDKMGL